MEQPPFWSTWRNLPNSLTLLRIASAPVIAALIATGNFKHAALLTVAAALTDAADGYLARSGSVADREAANALAAEALAAAMRQPNPPQRIQVRVQSSGRGATALGAALDPLADKVLAASAAVALAFTPDPIMQAAKDASCAALSAAAEQVAATSAAAWIATSPVPSLLPVPLLMALLVRDGGLLLGGAVVARRNQLIRAMLPVAAEPPKQAGVTTTAEFDAAALAEARRLVFVAAGATDADDARAMPTLPLLPWSTSPRLRALRWLLTLPAIGANRLSAAKGADSQEQLPSEPTMSSVVEDMQVKPSLAGKVHTATLLTLLAASTAYAATSDVPAALAAASDAARLAAADAAAASIFSTSADAAAIAAADTAQSVLAGAQEAAVSFAGLPPRPVIDALTWGVAATTVASMAVYLDGSALRSLRDRASTAVRVAGQRSRGAATLLAKRATDRVATSGSRLRLLWRSRRRAQK